MVIVVEKYDIMSRIPADKTEQRRAQVVCLFGKFHKDIPEIAEITGYSLSTVKNYIRKYQELENRYDDYFNFNVPSQTKRVRTPLAVFEDGYETSNVPNGSGLYLVGSTYIDPFTKKVYYWIKVGMSITNLAKRIKSYHTENPMIWIADILPIDDPNNVLAMENECHIILSEVAYGVAKDTIEWFIVDEDTYFEICKKGFHYFFQY